MTSFENKTFKTYGLAEGLLSSKVYSSIIDKNGKLWIGCEDGIYQIEDEKVNLVKEILGEHIKKFYEDRKGNLWAISTKNLYLFLENLPLKEDLKYFPLKVYLLTMKEVCGLQQIQLTFAD